MDNGLNSKGSIIKKIKVRKIQAVIKSAENNTYSNESYYWLYDDTGVIYDYELHYPIGTLERDNNNNFNIINNKIYIIDKLIQIPSYTLYE